MRGYKITPTTWIDDLHFVGTATKKVKMRVPNGTAYREEDHTEACYGWSKGGSFMVYIVSNGHIERLGTVKSDTLLDFRKVTV